MISCYDTGLVICNMYDHAGVLYSTQLRHGINTVSILTGSFPAASARLLRSQAYGNSNRTVYRNISGTLGYRMDSMSSWTPDGRMEGSSQVPCLGSLSRRQPDACTHFSVTGIGLSSLDYFN